MATVTSFDLDSTANGVNESIAYTENAGTTLLAQNAIVRATGNFNGQNLRISGLLSEDEIGFAGGVTIVGSAVQIGGIAFATFSGGSGGADLVFTFNSNAQAVHVETLLRNLTYEDASESPVAKHTLNFDLAGKIAKDNQGHER